MGARVRPPSQEDLWFCFHCSSVGSAPIDETLLHLIENLDLFYKVSFICSNNNAPQLHCSKVSL